MCRVTKHLFLEKGQLVFDYESQGDLFYMVVAGRVLCKIPFFKQLVMLSPDEKALFQVQFQKDLLGMQEAAEINKQLQLESQTSSPDHSRGASAAKNAPAGATGQNTAGKQGQRSKGMIDLSKLQHLKNPYDLAPR